MSSPSFSKWPAIHSSVPNPKTGEVEWISTGEFEQNKDPMRPGERIRLYKLMRHMSLDQMALAGGEERELLAAIKGEALAPLRRREERGKRRCSWETARPW